MAIVLLPQCMATSNTTAAVETSDAITSLAATAYSNYIATESTEPDFRSTIQPITTGNKPANTENMLHGWVQNMRGSVNNTFKWCGLLDLTGIPLRGRTRLLSHFRNLKRQRPHPTPLST